jgi:hypothetical protein
MHQGALDETRAEPLGPDAGEAEMSSYFSFSLHNASSFTHWIASRRLCDSTVHTWPDLI